MVNRENTPWWYIQSSPIRDVVNLSTIARSAGCPLAAAAHCVNP
jgi:hypothetical protein